MGLEIHQITQEFTELQGTDEFEGQRSPFGANSSFRTNLSSFLSFMEANIDELTFTNTGLKIQDSDASNTLTLTTGSNLTADRSLSINTGNSDRTITLNGNPTLNDWFDQGVKTSSNVTFSTISCPLLASTDLTINGADSIEFVITNAAAENIIFRDNGDPATEFIVINGINGQVTFDNQINATILNGTGAGGDLEVKGTDLFLKGDDNIYFVDGMGGQLGRINTTAAALFVDTDIDGTLGYLSLIRNETMDPGAIVATDKSALVYTNAGSANAIVLPNDTTLNLDIGFWCYISNRNTGAYQLDIQADSGVTIYNGVGSSTSSVILHQYQTVMIVKTDSNTYMVLNSPVSQETDLLIATEIRTSLNGLKVRDSDSSHYMQIGCASNLTADRILSVAPGDSNRTLTMTGDATLNQDVSSAGTPTFVGIKLLDNSADNVATITVPTELTSNRAVSFGMPDEDNIAIPYFKEGTWTPTIGDGVNNFTTTTAEGTWKQTENVVEFSLRVIWTSKGSASGAIVISLSASAAAGIAPVPVSFGYTENVTFSDMLAGSISASASSIDLWDIITGSGVGSVTAADCGTSGQMAISGKFFI